MKNIKEKMTEEESQLKILDECIDCSSQLGFINERIRIICNENQVNKEKPYVTILKYSKDYKYIEGICRISMLSPEYILGYNENMILTDNDKKELCHQLQIKFNETTEYTDDDKTRWEYAIDKINKFNRHGINLPASLPIPDYTKL